MTAYKITTGKERACRITCDSCYEARVITTTAIKRARAELATEGWTSNYANDNDLCQRCAQVKREVLAQLKEEGL